MIASAGAGIAAPEEYEDKAAGAAGLLVMGAALLGARGRARVRNRTKGSSFVPVTSLREAAHEATTKAEGPRKAWEKHRTFKFKDGIVRREISDEDVSFDGKVFSEAWDTGDWVGTLGQVMDHPALYDELDRLAKEEPERYAAMADLRNLTVATRTDMSPLCT